MYSYQRLVSLAINHKNIPGSKIFKLCLHNNIERWTTTPNKSSFNITAFIMFLCSLAEIIRVSIYLLQNPWHQIRLSAKALFVYALSGLSWRCYNVLSLIWANTHPADRPQRLGIYLTCQGGKVTVSHWFWQDDHTGLYVLYWKMSCHIIFIPVYMKN